MRLGVFNRWLWFLSGLNKSKMRSSVDTSKNKWITNGDYWLGLLSLRCFSREKDCYSYTSVPRGFRKELNNINYARKPSARYFIINFSKITIYTCFTALTSDNKSECSR